MFLPLALALSFTISAKEYHVAKTGNDNNKGTSESQLLSIQAAADVAQPSDISINEKNDKIQNFNYFIFSFCL
jgi:hypothetical protein